MMSAPTLSDVLSAIAGMPDSLAQMRGDITDMRGKVDGLRGKVDGLGGEVTRLSGEFIELRSEVNDVKHEQVSFREDLIRPRVDVMARIDHLQDDLTSFRDDNFVTCARVERLGDTTQAGIQGFEKEISGSRRQIRTLQEEVRQLRGER